MGLCCILQSCATLDSGVAALRGGLMVFHTMTGEVIDKYDDLNDGLDKDTPIP